MEDVPSSSYNLNPKVTGTIPLEVSLKELGIAAPSGEACLLYPKVSGLPQDPPNDSGAADHVKGAPIPQPEVNQFQQENVQGLEEEGTKAEKTLRPTTGSISPKPSLRKTVQFFGLPSFPFRH